MESRTWKYENPGWYLRATLKALEVVAGGGTVQMFRDSRPLDAGAFRDEWRRALDRRINAKARAEECQCRGCRDEWAYRRDQMAIRDYLTRRVVRSGSGLETREARERFPAVHERFRARDFD